MTAGPLAKFLKAPILLQEAGSVLNADTKAELIKLAVKKVYVTSGTAVISQAVLTELTGMGITVESLGGVDRFETSVNIAKKMVELGAPVTKVAVAFGWLNQDALSIASIAAYDNQPILLTEKNAVPPSVKAFLAANTGITKTDVIGGTGVISDAVKAEFPTATRHYGITAYDTNNQVIQDFASSLTFENVFVANAVTAIDALAGAPLAAMTKSPIVLTDGVSSPKAAAFTFSKATASTVTTALGGTAVVPEQVRLDIAAGKVTAVVGELAITSVSAINSTALTITGTSLASLTASDVTVADNTVASYSVSADGTSATVILDSALIVDEATAVTVNGQAFTVTYSLDATAAEVIVANYDNDTSDQKVAITVNGKATTYDDLVAAGYDVEFIALDAKTGGSDITDDIFADETTGELWEDLDTYLGTSTSKSPYVMVTLTKGSDVTTSALAKITIKNIDYVASSISDVTLTNTDLGDVDQNSTKLVTNEAAYIKNIKVTVDGNTETVEPGTFTVKSSNAGVVYTTTLGELTAVSPGTATLTITYGNVTKTISITVVKDERELTKVAVQKANTDTTISSLKIAEKPTNVELVALDQYGDRMSTDVFVKSSNSDILATGYDSVTTDATENGTTLILDPQDTGSTTLTFYSDVTYAYKIGTSALTLTVSDNADVSKSVLELYTPIDDADAVTLGGLVEDDFSTDATIDISDDSFVAFQLNQYNSSNVSLGYDVPDLPEIALSRADVADVDVTLDGKVVVTAGTKTGTATITVTDSITNLKYTKKITVVDQGNVIESVTWKSVSDPTYGKTFKYTSVLTTTDSGNDPKVSGITLTKAVSQAIRIKLDAGSETTGLLYVDKDGDGEYDSLVDTHIGNLEVDVLGDTLPDDIDFTDGVTVASGDDATITFKIVDTNGDVVAAKSIVDNF